MRMQHWKVRCISAQEEIWAVDFWSTDRADKARDLCEDVCWALKENKIGVGQLLIGQTPFALTPLLSFSAKYTDLQGGGGMLYIQEQEQPPN